MEMNLNEDNWTSDAHDLKEATISFLAPAMSAYLENNNIALPFVEGDKDD